MKQSTLILVIALVVVLIGGGVFAWLNWDQVGNLINRQTVNQDQNTNTAPANTNQPNLVAPEKIEGETKLTGTLEVNNVTVTLTGVTRTKNFESVDAAPGLTYVVVYFEPVTGAQILDVKRGFEQGPTKLTSGSSGAFDLAGLKIASTAIANDTGYLKFLVDEKITSLQLELGAGATVQKITLP